MKAKIRYIAISLLIAALMFWAGAAFNAMRYEDICLDMGGGRFPGDHPICVIEDRRLELVVMLDLVPVFPARIVRIRRRHKSAAPL